MIKFFYVWLFPLFFLFYFFGFCLTFSVLFILIFRLVLLSELNSYFWLSALYCFRKIVEIISGLRWYYLSSEMTYFSFWNTQIPQYSQWLRFVLQSLWMLIHFLFTLPEYCFGISNQSLRKYLFWVPDSSFYPLSALWDSENHSSHFCCFIYFCLKRQKSWGQK